MAEDDFELWLGRIGKDPGFRGSVRRVVNLAGALPRTGGGSRFTGARIGRGSGVGRLLASTGATAGRRARRVVVKARIVRLAGKSRQAAAAHLRYLQRDGTTRSGERGTLYGPGADDLDTATFLERGAGDRHQFRFIVAPEDGAEYDSLKPLTRRLMQQAERDLGTRLDWVAVDHFNTGNPHTHVIVRGTDERGRNLVIARDYIAQGFRERASELVTLDLGPRSEREITDAGRREIGQERFTDIDRRLLRAVDREGLVAPHHHDGREQSLRAGRIGTLARMGLAVRAGHLRWRLDPDLEKTLHAMGRRGDIMARLAEATRARGLAVAPAHQAIFDPADERTATIVGRVIARGLAGPDEDRSFLVIDGIDGRASYVDIGADDGTADPLPPDAIVRVAPARVEARAVDRTVAEIAAAHGGIYSADLHAVHDPGASERFIAAHVRRLEALRRQSRIAERGADGMWRIAPDHVDRALAHDRKRAGAAPVTIDVLASAPLGDLARHDGITVLDEDPDLARSEGLGGDFGRTVADARQRRRQWLVEAGLADRPDANAVLRRREFVRVAARLSRELGLPFVEAGEGRHVSGRYARSVRIGAVRMAVIEDGSSFSLVPWRRALERQLGREVSGRVRGSDVDWNFGRQRTRGPDR